MNGNQKTILTAAVITLPWLTLSAQPVAPPAAPKPTAGAGLVNDWLRDQNDAFSHWDIGGQARARFEYRDGFGILGQPGSVDFLKSGADTENSYLLLREKVHVGYAPADWLGGFVEARDSSSHGDERNPNVEADTFDLHQGYVTLGGGKAFPVQAKVGRQELSYGDERLVGAFDWNNLGRVFDAGKLHYQADKFWVDAFSGHLVLPDDDTWNSPNDEEWFSGIYASSKCVPIQTTDAYFLARNANRDSTRATASSAPAGGATARDIYTLGLRAKSLPGQLKGWDYSFEAAGQAGNFAPTADAERQDHLACAAHLGGGYTWEQTVGTPRLGVEYNFASGDNDPNDDEHGTFDNLFPTNHKFYGYMDMVAWQNIHNIRLTGSLKPLKKLSLSLDYHLFWLADTEDQFYQASGSRRAAPYGVNPGAGSYVGSEIDLVGTYTFTKWAGAQVGYGHFFRGDYVKDTLSAVGSQDADFVYAQVLLNF